MKSFDKIFGTKVLSRKCENFLLHRFCHLEHNIFNGAASASHFLVLKEYVYRGEGVIIFWTTFQEIDRKNPVKFYFSIFLIFFFKEDLRRRFGR